MSAEKMILTVLATEFVQAVVKDETPEGGGCDLSAGLFGSHVSSWLRDLAATLAEFPKENAPIDMLLHCPRCHVQHVDVPKSCDMGRGCDAVGVCYAEAHGEPERCTAWTNRPHRSHLCADCGYIWRPADVPTNGVTEIKTKGKDDSKVAGL